MFLSPTLADLGPTLSIHIALDAPRQIRPAMLSALSLQLELLGRIFKEHRCSARGWL